MHYLDNQISLVTHLLIVGTMWHFGNCATGKPSEFVENRVHAAAHRGFTRVASGKHPLSG
jgi:hypothetical protein